MHRMTKYLYLVDGINADKADKLQKAMLISDRISDVNIKINSGMVAVTASKDPEQELKMACPIAGCTFRMKVSKKKATYWA